MELARLSTSEFQNRAEGGKGAELHGGRGGHCREKPMLGGGDTTHTFLMWGTIGVEKENLLEGGEGHRIYFVDGRNN